MLCAHFIVVLSVVFGAATITGNLTEVGGIEWTMHRHTGWACFNFRVFKLIRLSRQVNPNTPGTPQSDINNYNDIFNKY